MLEKIIKSNKCFFINIDVLTTYIKEYFSEYSCVFEIKAKN
ncbi:hypothetical protein CSCA_4033 [Clostridium scatologenes]|uniref:Uncharacterized protein n=1 Tax=Clostridium scatologenes TaxID=1548 RepID=A0A0E3K2V2_CLOSL|nr:hypothetical protein CSCA_4033 [Clostridium scatologenes]